MTVKERIAALEAERDEWKAKQEESFAHFWEMVRQEAALRKELTQERARLDFLLATESGYEDRAAIDAARKAG